MIALRKLDGRGQGPPRRQRHLGCSVGKLSYYKLEHQELERSEAPPLGSTRAHCRRNHSQDLGRWHLLDSIVRKNLFNGMSNFTLMDESTNKVMLWVGLNKLFGTSAPSGADNDILLLLALNLEKLSAFKCRIFPCIKEYASAVGGGNLTENIHSTIPVPYYNASSPSFQLVSNRTLRNGSWEICNSSEENETDYLPVDNLRTANSTDRVWYPSDCVWRIGFRSFFSIRKELRDSIREASLFRNDHLIPEGPIQARKIWQEGKLDLNTMKKVMDDLADTMTATIRRTGESGGSNYVEGKVILNSTCVEVQWKWISYLGVLTVLTLSFFALFLLQSTNGRGHRVWKSSILPVLFCSLNDTIYDMASSEWTRDDIFQAAKGTDVQQSQDTKGRAKFVES